MAWRAPATINIYSKSAIATRRTTVTPIAASTTTSTGVIVGSATVASAVTLTVAPAGTLTVTTDLNVLGGTVSLPSTASAWRAMLRFVSVLTHRTTALVVGGSFNFTGGALSASAGSALSVAGALTIENGATFAPVIDVSLGTATSITFVVASFQARAGEFVVRSAVATFADANCFQFGTPTQVRMSCVGCRVVWRCVRSG